MSGPLSVPAAIAAFYVPNDVAKLFLALTAIACFVFTAYWIWRAERNKVIDMELALEQERSAPNLSLEFDRSKLGCYEITGVAPKKVITVRVLPTTDSRIENCRGQLLRICESVDGISWGPTNYIDALTLKWTHQRTEVDHRPLLLSKGVQQTLDVFKISERDATMTPSTLSHPRALPDFTSAKWYRFDVKILGDGGAEAEISLRVKRGMSWDDLTIEKV